MLNNLKVEIVDINSIKPHPRNPRIHPKSAIKKLIQSIKEFGWTNPILVSVDNVILAGHARLKAAQEMGLKEVPVIRLNMDNEKVIAYLIADNRLQDETDWDYEKLVELVDELYKAGMAELTGFDSGELAKISFEIMKEVSPYSYSIDSVQYKPRGEAKIEELVDRVEYERLIRGIEAADVDEKVKKFLLDAATRFLRFNFGKIADYYARASEKEQKLFEKLALVIIDFDDAIANGFVRYTKIIEKLIKEQMG